jgi:hypothetical protein
MADGSAGVIEAGAAASDAAVEARREALEQGKTTVAKPATAPAKTVKPAKPGKPDWHQFEVTGWLTNFNSIEFGFWKKERNKAKSRQFTNDMDIFADISEGGVRTEMLGYREDLWTKNVGMDKRLVFKLFSESLNWRGTMDLMLARSIQQTLGARGLPVMTYAMNTNDHEQVVYLERSANKWPLMPENFSFFLLEDGRLEFYRIRQDLLCLGADYTVYNQRGEMIAHLDGRIFNLASKWKCRVRADHKEKRILSVLKMFCGMLIFNGQCRRHIETLAVAIQHGKANPKIERQEADLYMNPRRVR